MKKDSKTTSHAPLVGNNRGLPSKTPPLFPFPNQPSTPTQDAYNSETNSGVANQKQKSHQALLDKYTILPVGIKYIFSKKLNRQVCATLDPQYQKGFFIFRNSLMNNGFHRKCRFSPPFCHYITATFTASFQNCYETRGPDDTVCKSSSPQSPPGGSPRPNEGGEPRLHPLGEDRPDFRAARAGEGKKGKSRWASPWERHFNGSPIGKRSRNFTLSLSITR